EGPQTLEDRFAISGNIEFARQQLLRAELRLHCIHLRETTTIQANLDSSLLHRPQPLLIHAWQTTYLAHQHRLATSNPYLDELQALLLSTPPFAPAEFIDLATLALNLTIARANVGCAKAMESAHAISLKLLHFDLSSRSVPWQGAFLKNMVALLCRFGAPDQAEQLLESRSHQIHPEEAEFAAIFNRAVIRFHQGRFRDALHLLHNELPNLKHPLYAISGRVYLCKTLYECGEFSWLSNALKAFKTYLRRRTDLPLQHREKCLAFCRYLSRLNSVRMASPSKGRALMHALLQELEGTVDLVRSPWLRAKLEDQVERD
ncbi:MAG: hypothetical protein AAF570_22690, partial [Bacteroidota bacterium]